jgi:signal transduction histidine kinase/ActR/RegA family two-component response regulator
MQANGLAFGDTTRPSASILFVPIRNAQQATGVLSIQSYTPGAYDQRSLATLQALADHCGGALDRIKTITERDGLENQFRQAQKMEAVGQLAGGVAHDFNNLLTVISGHAELLLMPGPPGRDQGESLKQILAASDRAANLTRQLLAFSRKQVMQPQPLHLNEVIGNCTKMLRRIIGEDLYLQCNYEPRLPLIQADVGMIEQVLVNLVVNARDAMPAGGKLIISTETVCINGAYPKTHLEASAGDAVCLTISDTGTGIRPEILPRIFEPFFTTKETGKGTGLGLATVYGIVKQHQGWIEVASEPCKGTTFKIFLPPTSSPGPVAAAADPELKPEGGTERILLVEDDETVRRLTRMMLEKFGYQVQEAASGRDALALCEHDVKQMDLLLTDIVMPHGVNGRELADSLRARRSDLKVIFMSGYSGDALNRDTEYLQRSHSHFLSKPCPWHKLVSTVRQCLDEN